MMTMEGIMLATTAFLGQCQNNISFLNHGGWLNITALVVIITLMASAMVYALSGLLPAATRERLRGVVKYEYVQGIFSVILIIVLFSVSLAACDVGGALTQGTSLTYSDPYQFANYYIGNLLFSKGITLTTGMWTAAVGIYIDAFFITYGLSLASSFIPPLTIKTLGLTAAPLFAASGGADQPATIVFDYSTVLNVLLEPIVVVTFGLLFVVFLALPAIEALALTLVIPVAIIMRSFAFTGPRLREASNALIALAIAFYFVFPLTIAMNYYVVNWTYCIGNSGSCNPYSGYLVPYKINSFPLNQLFNDPEVISNLDGFTSIPLNFWSAIAQSNGGLAQMAQQVVNGLINLPQLITNYVTYTAQYLFQAIFLMALDVGITIGFATGLNKGLGAMGQILGAGPFWS